VLLDEVHSMLCLHADHGGMDLLAEVGLIRGPWLLLR
jgi:hypothetical protein